MQTKQVKLGSLCTITSSKRIFEHEYVEDGIPFYRSKEIIEKESGKPTSLNICISVDRFKEIKSRFGVPKPNDMLITSVGTLGIPYIVKQDDLFYFKDGNLTWLKNFSNLLDPKYLYYWIKSDFGKQSLIQRAIGSSQPAITIDILKKYQILIPDVVYQKKIASILSTYDDLIEKNNRKIAILQEMAEEIYKEWFVRFRFPGYKTAKFKDGIPEGWKYRPFSAIVTYERGISYSSEEINCEDGVNLINLKNINAYGGFRLDGTKKYNGKYKEAQIVTSGDLVMGVTDMTQDRRTIGAVALIPPFDNTCVISADLIKLVSHIDNIFIYCLCKYGYYSKFFSQFANGSNVLHLKPSSLRNQKVLIPTEELINRFVKIVKPINDTINHLNRQNDILTQQRDLLLPRLMSGKLEVKA